MKGKRERVFAQCLAFKPGRTIHHPNLSLKHAIKYCNMKLDGPNDNRSQAGTMVLVAIIPKVP